MKKTTRFLWKASAAACAATLLASTSLHAAWTSFNLPPLSQSFGSYWAGHMSDGRLVYGSNSDLDLQSSFGSSTLLDYNNAGTWDPSALAIFSNSIGAIGQGTFGASSIYLFDPSNLATGFTAISGVTIQNYGLAFRDSSSLYVAGLNGSQMNIFALPKHSVSYVTTDGSVNKVIIDNVSDFSGNIALDLAGNLYVSNNDDGGLYKFTAAQLSAAISGTALGIGDGQFLTTIAQNSSLAVDSLGRIITAGYGGTGIDIYDPANNTHTNLMPALANQNYVVSTFSDGVQSYIAYINASGSSTGSTLTYGYDTVANVVPEPGSVLLLCIGVAGVLGRRRRV